MPEFFFVFRFMSTDQYGNILWSTLIKIYGFYIALMEEVFKVSFKVQYRYFCFWGF